MAHSCSQTLCETTADRRMFFLLARSHLAMLCEKRADSRISLDQFYELVENDTGIFERRGMTKDERIWLLAFAKYLDIIEPSKGRYLSKGMIKSLAESLEAIDFGNVRSLYKRVFNPAYLCEVKRVLYREQVRREAL